MSLFTRRFLMLCCVLVFSVPAFSSDPWRPGHIYCPDASKAAPAGELPRGTEIILEDGTAIDAASLAPDDAFRQLLEHWVKARRAYHSDPTMVNGFAYKLDSMNIGPGVRNVEIRYEAAGVLAHVMKGVTHIVK